MDPVSGGAWRALLTTKDGKPQVSDPAALALYIVARAKRVQVEAAVDNVVPEAAGLT